MGKRAIWGLLLATVIPLAGYVIVKHYSEKAVQMPLRYFHDGVDTIKKDGRITIDTAWHSAKNITLVNQLGDTVSLDSLKNKIIVINFFFTRCPSICPGLALKMQKLQQSFASKNSDSIVQFISISVDPENDSVPQLRKFADRYTKNHNNWWFVTGNRQDIYDFGLKELKANIADADVDSVFIHTQYFFLLDRHRVVRGWYNGFDDAKQAKLVRDIPLLMLEKERKRSFGEFLKELFGRS